MERISYSQTTEKTLKKHIQKSILNYGYGLVFKKTKMNETTYPKIQPEIWIGLCIPKKLKLNEKAYPKIHPELWMGFCAPERETACFVLTKMFKT